jgi:hypothetical protein
MIDLNSFGQESKASSEGSYQKLHKSKVPVPTQQGEVSAEALGSDDMSWRLHSEPESLQYEMERQLLEIDRIRAVVCVSGARSNHTSVDD